MSRSDRALEIAFLLTILHGRFRYAVVGARLAALGDSGGGDLGDDGVERRRLRLDRAGARHVADRAIADRGLERHLVGVALDVRVLGVEHAVPAEDAAAVGAADWRVAVAHPVGGSLPVAVLSAWVKFFPAPGSPPRS